MNKGVYIESLPLDEYEQSSYQVNGDFRSVKFTIEEVVQYYKVQSIRLVNFQTLLTIKKSTIFFRY